MQRFVAAVLSVCLVMPAIAGPLEDGVAAFGRGDIATALRVLQPLAEQGNPLAKAVLGSMYDEGKGVAQDLAKASTLYREAARSDVPQAQMLLGRMYETGRGVPESAPRALMWLNIASSHRGNGNVRASARQYRDQLRARMAESQLGQAGILMAECLQSKFANCEADLPVSPPDDPSAATTLSPAVSLNSHALTVNDYPFESIRRREQGKNSVKFVIGIDGTAGECEIVETSGAARLDEAACLLVSHWLYKPATAAGRPVPQTTTATVTFQVR
jgi:TonB family protein